MQVNDEVVKKYMSNLWVSNLIKMVTIFCPLLYTALQEDILACSIAFTDTVV